MPPYQWSDPSVTVFVVMPLVLAGLFAAGVWWAWRRTGESPAVAERAAIGAILGVVVWMVATAAAAYSGVLREWDRTPPPFLVFAFSMVALSCALAFGTVGRRIAVAVPLWALVAVQSFRFPLELAMHRLYERGIMPIQMTYTGRNFDILTGIAAIVVAVLVVTGRAGRGLVALWNIVGFALLANIVIVAILSTPRFRYFGDEQTNVFVAYMPFVWLPAVMVPAALTGHLIIFRALKHTGGSRQQAANSPQRRET